MKGSGNRKYAAQMDLNLKEKSFCFCETSWYFTSVHFALILAELTVFS
jgi:hypothetical protein